MSDQVRIFKIGSTRIMEDESMRGLSTAEVQELLKPLYPQVVNATAKEQTTEDGTIIVEFLPLPGRKG